jgi:hypothetical protein
VLSGLGVDAAVGEGVAVGDGVEGASVGVSEVCVGFSCGF